MLNYRKQIMNTKLIIAILFFMPLIGMEPKELDKNIVAQRLSRLSCTNDQIKFLDKISNLFLKLRSNRNNKNRTCYLNLLPPELLAELERFLMTEDSCILGILGEYLAPDNIPCTFNYKSIKALSKEDKSLLLFDIMSNTMTYSEFIDRYNRLLQHESFKDIRTDEMLMLKLIWGIKVSRSMTMSEQDIAMDLDIPLTDKIFGFLKNKKISEFGEQLIDAAGAGFLNRIIKLHAIGVDLKCKYCGTTALIRAAESVMNDKSLAIIEFLISNGQADINAKNSYGSTALVMATVCARVNIVRYLLENGADANISRVENYKKETQSLLGYVKERSELAQSEGYEETYCRFKEIHDLLVQHGAVE